MTTVFCADIRIIPASLDSWNNYVLWLWMFTLYLLYYQIAAIKRDKLTSGEAKKELLGNQKHTSLFFLPWDPLSLGCDIRGNTQQRGSPIWNIVCKSYFQINFKNIPHFVLENYLYNTIRYQLLKIFCVKSNCQPMGSWDGKDEHVLFLNNTRGRVVLTQVPHLCSVVNIS